MKWIRVVPLKTSVKWAESLTYYLPDGYLAQPGDLVKVPFGKQSILGVVIEICPNLESGLDADKVKPIAQVYPGFRLSQIWLELVQWMSSYYRAPLPRVMRLLFPKNLKPEQLGEPLEVYYRLSSSLPELKGSRQQAIVKILSVQNPCSLEDLKKELGFNPSASIKSLVARGVVTEEKVPVYTPFNAGGYAFPTSSIVLTNAQNEALQKIKQAKKPILLHGVTGSGKTEIYLRIILDTVKLGKQAVLLLPEIALTPQIFNYFEQYFGEHIAIFHSHLTDAERARQWWKVKTGFAPLIIGSRSAFFAPVKNVGVIILDEEHEWTYKQESSPHYETHRLAEFIHNKSGCHLIFASATPKAESYYQAQVGEYDYIHLPERIQQSEMPAVQVVDLREEFKKRNFSIFSLNLQNKISDRLQKKEQIILFVNQRGLANAVVCRDCGYKEECPNCEISLKLHQHQQSKLICHYCNYSRQPVIQCPQCQSVYIKNIGVGTQRVEQEVHHLFPGARVIRADADSIKDKQFSDIYHEFLNQEYDVLIGTQMVAKGLDFSNVTLIGIILADIGLHIPDFRSSERLFQVLTQVAGRSGRGEKTGEVILQTYQPDHPTIQKIAAHAYKDFINEELKIREKLSYPPFNRMIKFTIVGFDEKQLAQHIKVEKEILEDIFRINELPVKIMSAPSLIPKVANRYYYQVLIRSQNPQLIFDHWTPPKGWRIDVDPVNTV